MYVVTGATGNTGAVVADTLLNAGKQVRMIVRSAEKAAHLARRGAEVVVADLSDQRALANAFADAEGVYLMSPPDRQSTAFIAERKQLTGAIARTLRDAKARHVVLLSSVGAQAPSGTGQILSLHNAELQLRETGLPATFVRASYFAENWASVLPVAKQDGVLPSFLPLDLKVPTVATRDIGIVAAQALLDGPRGLRTIELAGPQDVSARDVADAVGKLLGRTVQAIEAPLESVVPTFTSFGLSPEIAALFREMFAGLADGTVRKESSAAPTRGTTSIAEVLRALL